MKTPTERIARWRAVAATVLLFLAFVSHSSAQTPVPLTSPDARAIADRLRAYQEDLRSVLHGNGAPTQITLHFGDEAAKWYQDHANWLAGFNTTFSRPLITIHDRQVSAIDALCRYGPPMIDPMITGLFFHQDQAIVLMTEGGRTWHLLMKRNTPGDWRLANWFWADVMIYRPLILQDKMLRGEPLSADDRDFQANGRRRAQESFSALCLAAKAPLPGRPSTP